MIFEESSGYQEVFFFDTPRIMTKDELKPIIVAAKAENERGLKECFSKVVEERLKIRLLGEDLLIVKPPKDAPPRYVAYFLEASAI